MSVSPFQAFEHLKETIIGYLETAYKVSHPDIFAERRALLEASGVVAQQPYIETTPAYPSGRWLRDVIAAHPDKLPKELVQLMAFGTPLGKNPLWIHQDDASEKWRGSSPNLVVATGAASGKTEIFLAPILSRLLQEGQG